MTRRQLTIVRILFAAYLIAVLWLCFGNFSSTRDMPRELWGIPLDKIVHFLMFLPFPLLCYYAIGKNPSGPWKAIGAVVLIFGAGCLIAAATEIVQDFLPYRSADPKDFKADTAALALVSLVVFILMLIKGIRQSRNAR